MRKGVGDDLFAHWIGSRGEIGVVWNCDPACRIDYFWRSVRCATTTTRRRRRLGKRLSWSISAGARDLRVVSVVVVGLNGRLLLLLLSRLPRFAAASSASCSSTAPTASLSRAVLSVDL